jgi:hypothetical protein
LERELRDYVFRDGKLGEYWERVKGSASLEGLTNPNEGEAYNEMDGVMVEAPDDSDGPETDNRYHDALDEPLGDTVDLASIDEPREGTFISIHPSLLR